MKKHVTQPVKPRRGAACCRVALCAIGAGDKRRRARVRAASWSSRALPSLGSNSIYDACDQLALPTESPAAQQIAGEGAHVMLGPVAVKSLIHTKVPKDKGGQKIDHPPDSCCAHFRSPQI